MDFTTLPSISPDSSEVGRRRQPETVTVTYCSQCREDRDPQELLGDDCTMCGTKVTRIRRILPASISSARDDPIAPGMGFFEGLLDIMGGSAELREELEAMMRGDTGATKPISNEFLKTIGRVTIDSHGGMLIDVTLKIGPYKALLIPSNFAPLPALASIISGKLIKADPEYGEHEFSNSSDIKGSIVVLKRGKVTFLDKLRQAQAAGAVAAIVCQAHDTWPFVMTDNDPAAGVGLTIPLLMVSKKDASIIEGMFATCRVDRCIDADVCSERIDPLCSICHDSFAAGDIVLKLPCRHMYHESCVISWLESHNTCPLCRHTMPVQDATEGGIHGPVTSRDSTNAARQPYFM